MQLKLLAPVMQPEFLAERPATTRAQYHRAHGVSAEPLKCRVAKLGNAAPEIHGQLNNQNVPTEKAARMKQAEIVRRLSTAITLTRAIAVVRGDCTSWHTIQAKLPDELRGQGWRVATVQFDENSARIALGPMGKRRRRTIRTSSDSEFRRVLKDLDESPTLLIIENPEYLVDPDLQPFANAEHIMRSTWQLADSLSLLWTFESRRSCRALLDDHARPFYSSALLLDIA